MRSCNHCGEYISSNRPKCGCEECVRERRRYCIYCCFVLNPAGIRPLITIKEPITNIDSFQCYRCLRIYILTTKCYCCTTAVLCRVCCQNDYHPCCSIVSVRFSNRGLRFAYPCIDKDQHGRNVGWIDRTSSERLLSKMGSSIPLRLNPKGFTTNSSRRFVATELEFLDYHNARSLNPILSSWNCSVVEDGSIARGYNVENPNPREFVEIKPFEINTTPACGDIVFQQLTDICEELQKSKVKIHPSCGIHVHIDCRDFGYQELQRLIRIYCKIEIALFAAVHHTRYNSEFCAPCGDIFYDQFIKGIKPDTKGLKQSIIAGIYGKEAITPTVNYERQRSVPFHVSRRDHYGRITNSLTRNPMRYSAMNLHSYFLRGTVESRIHHASDNLQEIWGWVKLLVDLFDSIYKISDQKLEKILLVTNDEILGALELINASQFRRSDLNIHTVARGVVILRSLLPDDSFQTLIHKIKAACLDVRKTLPCQNKKVEG